MLGEVSSYHQEKFVETIEIGDLSMRPNNIPVSDLDKTELLEELNRAPERSFTTTWVISNGRLFWIDVSVVGPVSEEPKRYFSLGRRETKSKRQAITDKVEFLKEKLR